MVKAYFRTQPSCLILFWGPAIPTSLLIFNDILCFAGRVVNSYMEVECSNLWPNNGFIGYKGYSGHVLWFLQKMVINHRYTLLFS